MADETHGSDTNASEPNEEEQIDLIDDLIRAEYAELARMHRLRRHDTSQNSGDGRPGTDDLDQSSSDKP